MDNKLRNQFKEIYEDFLFEYEFDNSIAVSENVYNFITELGEEITPILMENKNYSDAINKNTDFPKLVCCKLINVMGLDEGIVNVMYSAPETAESDIAWNFIYKNVQETLINILNNIFTHNFVSSYIENGNVYRIATLGEVFDINDDNEIDDDDTYCSLFDYNNIIEAAKDEAKNNGDDLNDLRYKYFVEYLEGGANSVGMSIYDIVKGKNKTVYELACEQFDVYDEDDEDADYEAADIIKILNR